MPQSRTFLVEAYAPATSVLATLERQAEAVVEVEPDAAVRHIRSILVPEDEICLHLFEASSADSLALAMRRVELRAQRIVEVVS